MNTTAQPTEITLSYTETLLTEALLWESHCHPHFEMIAVLKGEVTLLSEGKKYTLSGGEIALIPPLLYHTVTAAKRGEYHRVTLLFDGELIPEVIRPRFSEGGTGIRLLSSAHPEALKRIATAEDRDFYRPLLHSLLVEILYACVASGSTPADGVDRFLQSAIRYIDAHLCERLLLDEIAAYTAHSKSSLCHLFHEKMKISIKQYILEKRLALAVKMIREGVPATIAAARVGYENYSNFYRVFYKRYGHAPSTLDK